jgi:flagellar biosynthetic protein FlhB
MADIDQDQKTEQPTEKKLSEAFDRGQFARSPELTVLLLLAGFLGVMGLTAKTASREIADYSVAMFTRFGTMHVDLDSVPSQVGEAMLTVGRVVGPLMLACVGAAVLSGGLQSGFRMSPNAIGFKPENLDPVAGFGKIFNKAAYVKLVVDALKLTAIAAALYFGARGLMLDPLFSTPVEAAYLGQFLQNSTLIFLSRLIFALGVVTAISYGYEKFKTSREMMMTRQEVKDEQKSAEGNQQAKSAMRRMARRLLQKQMLSAVATADVVVTNPTHFAVALKYERGKDKAPVILAKGENRFAQRIKALAAENGVPMVENKPVARMLFAMGKVGETIPAELYQAVAGILAVVYRTHRYYFHRLKARRLEESMA